MIKKTGRVLTVNEFKKLNQCLECRKMLDMKKGSICEECKKLNRTRCEYCSIVLRNDKEKKNKFYVYYDNSVFRDKVVTSYTSNKPIREYKVETKINYPKHDNNLCEECFNFINKVTVNHLEYNSCVIKNCTNFLLDTPEPQQLVDYLKVYGRLCKHCRNI